MNSKKLPASMARMNCRCCWQVVLPLSKPILLTVGLFYAVGHWNEFFNAILYLNNAKLQPLPVLLRNILLAANMNEYVEYDAFSSASVQAIKAASVFLTMLPMVIIYPWIQNISPKAPSWWCQSNNSKEVPYQKFHIYRSSVRLILSNHPF